MKKKKVFGRVNEQKKESFIDKDIILMESVCVG